jgi:predicted Fe-S protein YdhL (DUF1289 family)
MRNRRLPDPVMQSPCRQICRIQAKHCLGCGRTIEQITNWAKYTENQREEIMRQAACTTISQRMLTSVDTATSSEGK